MLLLEQLKQIPDHRGIQGRKYPLWLLMSLIVVGKFCGHHGYRPLADFCAKYREKLGSFLKIDESLDCPSYSTFRRAMIDIHPTHWEKVFNAWALATMPSKIGTCSSIDGKSIKNFSKLLIS
jgi:DDE_Tnp_1-associated